MNKRPFLIYPYFYCYSPSMGRQQILIVPKYRLPDLFRFPIAGDKYITSIRDGDSSKAISGGRKL